MTPESSQRRSMHNVGCPEAADVLLAAGRVVLTCHVKPDADALGSMAALARWLGRLGKTVETIVPTLPPAKYAFLDPAGTLRVAGRDVRLADVATPDLVCVVDTCTWPQLAGMEPLLKRSGATILAIDHHRTVDPLADYLLTDADAAATVVLIHNLLRHANAEIDATTATFLLAGLVADTDWFRLPSVRADTFRLAADLVEAGAVPHRLHEDLHLSDDLTKVQLLGRAIETLRPALGGKVMVMRLTQALFRELGADVGDTENLVNECLKVRGTHVGVMLVEADRGQVRVSLRSRPPVNVLRVAEHFGGGGHARAAGAKVSGTIDRVEKQVLAEVQKVLDEAEKP